MGIKGLDQMILEDIEKTNNVVNGKTYIFKRDTMVDRVLFEAGTVFKLSYYIKNEESLLYDKTARLVFGICTLKPIDERSCMQGNNSEYDWHSFYNDFDATQTGNYIYITNEFNNEMVKFIDCVEADISPELKDLLNKRDFILFTIQTGDIRKLARKNIKVAKIGMFRYKKRSELDNLIDEYNDIYAQIEDIEKEYNKRYNGAPDNKDKAVVNVFGERL